MSGSLARANGSRAKPPLDREPDVGILALQGGFALHEDSFGRLAVPTREVRTVEDLSGLNALVLPGGESSAILKLMEKTGLERAIVDFVVGGGALFATCAGLILAAKNVEGPRQRSLGLIDIDVTRNDYGRQIDSFETDLAWSGGSGTLRGVFIRAPKVTRLGPSVSVLARFEDSPVLLREDRVLAAAFHPELTPDTQLYRYFLEEILGVAIPAS